MSRHLPHLDWILSEETLSADSSRELAAHLAECRQCRSITEGWEAARHMIVSSGMETPRAGFAARWTALADQREHAPKVWQAWAFLAATGLGSIALAGGLAAQTATLGFSLAGAFSRTVTRTAETLSNWSESMQALGMVSNTVSRSTPAVLWLTVIFILSILSVVWLIFLYRIFRKGTEE